jgi:signal transduction histidine kinase
LSNDAAKLLFGERCEKLPAELLSPVLAGEIPGVKTRAFDSGTSVYDLKYIQSGNQVALIFDNDMDFSRVDDEIYKLTMSINREFRSPLTMIFSASGLLSDKLSLSPDARAKKYLSVINQSGYRLLRAVNNIFDLARYEKGDTALNLQTLNLSAFCREKVEKARPIAEEIGISLSYEAAQDEIILSFDTEKIERLLFNLLSNAFKYTKKGQVSVRVSAFGTRAFISVNDTGDGIPPDVLPYAFRRFAMKDRENSLSMGFGLGLGIVNAIACLHGGSVALETRAGEGTKVTVLLPIENRDSEMLREKSAVPDYAGGFSHVLLEFSDILLSEQYIREDE